MSELNDKQKKFAQEYIVDFNRTQAAIRAGYSKKTARFQGYRLYTNVYIQDEIKKLLADRRDRALVEEEEIIQELRKLAFYDLGDVVTIDENGVQIRNNVDTSCVAEAHEITTKKSTNIKVKGYDKVKALELLSRYLGILKDNMRHSGAVLNPLIEQLEKYNENTDNTDNT